MILPASLPAPIGSELQSLRRDYEKKDLEISNRKGPKGFRVPFEAFVGLVSEKKEIFSFVKKFCMKGKENVYDYQS